MCIWIWMGIPRSRPPHPNPLPPAGWRGKNGGREIKGLPLPAGPDQRGRPAEVGNVARARRYRDGVRALARDILRAAEKALLPARVGVAASKLAARIAAGLPDTPTVVPEGEESRFLAPLPLERLAPALEIAATLDRWGLHSIGDFAKLPEGEVASRLGEAGRELHATARGIDPRPLEPYLPPPSFSEGMDLEWPLASLEPFLFVAHAALERLVRRLESQALACTRLEVSIKSRPRRPRRPRDRAARPDPRRQDPPHPRPPRARSPPARSPRRRLRLLRAPRLPAPRAAFTLRPRGPLARPPRHHHRASRRAARRGPRRLPARARRPPPRTLHRDRLRPAPAAPHPPRAARRPRPARCPRAAPGSRTRSPPRDSQRITLSTRRGERAG